MIFDVILIAILALTMVFGFRRGFVYTFIHTIGWVLSIVLAFVWSPKLQDFLIEKTSLKNSIYEAFLAKFSQSLAFRDESIENLPAILKKTKGHGIKVSYVIPFLVFFELLHKS